MNQVALRREVTRSYSGSYGSDEPVEFGNGLRARLENVGVIGEDGAVMERRALERKLLFALPELAGVRGGLPPRLRVPHTPFATLVYHAKLVAAEPLEHALAEAERRKEPVGRVLTACGLLSERDVERVLAEQRGLAYVRVHGLDLDPRLSGVLPARTASTFNALPLGYLEDVPVVAVADPTDDVAMERIAAQAGEVVTFVASSPHDIAAGRRRLYGPDEVEA